MTRRVLGFTLVEVLVAAGLVALVGTYLGRLANAGREAVQQSEGQSQAAQILARLGGEAQRGNPRVVPPGGTRLLEGAALAELLGREAPGYRAEVRSSAGAEGLREYALRVCWGGGAGCVEGRVQGPAPLAAPGGEAPGGGVALGRGTLEVLVEGGADAPPQVLVSGPASHEVRRWGLSRLEGLPPGSYRLSPLPLRDARYDYRAAPLEVERLEAGGGARAVVRYQPVSGALALAVSAPAGSAVNALVSGPSGTFTVRESATLPHLEPGLYTLAAGPVPCGDYQCTARVEGAPAQVAPGQTAGMRLAYGYASANLQVALEGVGRGDVRLAGPGGFEAAVETSATLRDLPPGAYTLTPRPVRQGGYTFVAEAVAVELEAGQTAQARVAYAPSTARLRLRVEGSERGGVLGRVLRGGEALASFGAAGGEWELAPGRYSVQPLGYAEGDFLYEAAPQEVTLEAGRTTEAVVRFAPASAVLEFSAAGLPAGVGAQAWLRGPGGFEQALPSGRKLVGLEPGAYAFTAAAVKAGDYAYAPRPAEARLALAAGGRYALAVEYVRQEGAVRLSPEGLPPGAAARVAAELAGGGRYDLAPGVNPALPTGAYRLQAEGLSHGGFAYLPQLEPPAFALEPGQTAEVRVRYVRQSGTLELGVEGLEAGDLELEGPMGLRLERSGRYPLPPGDYRLLARAVRQGGFTYAAALEPAAFRLAVGQTVAVRAVYAPVTARLEVSVGGVGGVTPISLAGPASRALEGAGVVEDLPPGGYTLTPLEVVRQEPTPYGLASFAYRAAAQELRLVAGQTARAAVAYARQQGDVAVSVSGLPAGVSANLRLQGAGLDHAFAGGLLEGLPAAEYSLTPAGVRHGPYAYTAEAQAFRLEPGERESLTVRYAAQSGALAVEVEGPSPMPTPSVRVLREGREVATLQGSATLPDLAPGAYTLQPLTLRDEGGFDYAAEGATVEVAAGQTARARVRYVKLAGTVRLSLAGSPTGQVTLEGPRGYAWSASGSYEIPSGSYRASAPGFTQGGFSYQGTVSPAEFSLAPGAVVELGARWRKVAGRFRFTVSGLPQGAAAAVALSGPSPYSANLPGGVTATPDLLPGSYRLTTPDLLVGGYTYRAGGNAGAYALADGEVKEVGLAYAPVSGRLRVVTSGLPSAPAYAVSGPASLWVSAADQSFDDLPPGTYTANPPTLEADAGGGVRYRHTPSGSFSAAVSAGQTARIDVAYATSGSVVLEISRSSANAPVDVTFAGKRYTAPGRYVVNYLAPGVYPLDARATSNRGIAFYPSGPAQVEVRGGATASVSVSYAPENKAVLDLEIVKNYSGSDPRFKDGTPPALKLLQGGVAVYTDLKPGTYALALTPGLAYALDQPQGYQHMFAEERTGTLGRYIHRYYWRLHAVGGLPLDSPAAGEVYPARAEWRGVYCRWRQWGLIFEGCWEE